MEQGATYSVRKQWIINLRDEIQCLPWQFLPRLRRNIKKHNIRLLLFHGSLQIEFICSMQRRHKGKYHFVSSQSFFSLTFSSAEVKNAWSYTSTPQYSFMAWCLAKHRDNLTFYLLPLCYFTTSSILVPCKVPWFISYSDFSLRFTALEDKVGWTCGTHGGRERCLEAFAWEARREETTGKTYV